MPLGHHFWEGKSIQGKAAPPMEPCASEDFEGYFGGGWHLPRITSGLWAVLVPRCTCTLHQRGAQGDGAADKGVFFLPCMMERKQQLCDLQMLQSKTGSWVTSQGGPEAGERCWRGGLVPGDGDRLHCRAPLGSCRL